MSKIYLSQLDERNYLTALKAFAVLSIVSAHSGYVSANTYELNIVFSWILNQFGSIGVGIFFIISGYLFYKNKYSIDAFFKKKLNTIFIPWILTGTMVYLYVTLRKSEVTIEGLLNFLSGNGSYLYYLTLLVVFYLVFFFTSKNNIFVLSILMLSCLSILLTAMGFFNEINPFLNPFNFAWYFCLGLFIASNNLLMKVAEICSKYKYFFLVIYILLLIIIKTFNLSSGYWGISSLVIQPISIALIFGLANFSFVYNKNFLILGKESFSIYLLHMPAAGLIAFIFNIYNLWLLTLLRPFIVIVITLILIYLYKYLDDKFNVSKFTNGLIGVR
ncbi:acyltransferase family protein [Planococcus sp. SE5232]|uniref:acyltransferase family protein n=1 Tax=unclassified Planococcus (in: firmicutes) TaxID=2662419 RepID=UPI003D6A40E0